MNWRKTSRYNRHSKVEAAISRYKRVIGDTLKSRDDARRATEVAIAVKSLNRMRDLEQAVCSCVGQLILRMRRCAPREPCATTPLDAGKLKLVALVETIGVNKWFRLNDLGVAREQRP
jgi:hypothetical protein